MEDAYEPKCSKLKVVKSRISATSWARRVQAARQDEQVLKQVLDVMAGGASENAAIAEVLSPSRRSWAVQRLVLYRRHGIEGLIDGRTPREPTLSRSCRSALEAAREANPRISVEEAVVILERQKVHPLPSESTIKRVFRQVDDRIRYHAKKMAMQGQRPKAVVEESLAGGELLLAAEVETGGVAVLTEVVTQYAQAAKQEGDGCEGYVGDRQDRNRKGQFTKTYNRKRRRRGGEQIAGYLRSAEEKAEGRPPTWPRLVRERPATVDAKLRALTFVPLLPGGKGWSALRSPDFEALEYLAGYAYMPSTLEKFVSASAICGLGPRLLEAAGSHWHGVAQERWGEPGAMAAFYVDNHAKEVWSSLFTKSGKVSHRNRVMPCITTTYVHTGAGTPLVMSVQSGSAPLAPRLVSLVRQAEQMTDSTVKRAVVIDSEGSTFDILQAFDAEDRVIVTPLKPSRTGELELRYRAGSYFRPFRDNDELRVAEATLHHKSTGRSLELGALVVRRERREEDVVLLTTGLRLGMSGRDLAELYFARWPLQENKFKEWASSVKLDQHRGNCGQMVSNVAVVTELEQLHSRRLRDEQKLEELLAAQGEVQQTADRRRSALRKAEAALEVRRRRLDARVEQGRTSGEPFARCAVEHQQALGRAEAARREAEHSHAALDRSRERETKLRDGLAKVIGREKKLEPQREIRQLDVAQDMILTALKLTAAQLIAFVLREYLPSMKMTPETFKTRVLPTRGRREIYETNERVVFYANPRDPQVNAALSLACQRLNERNIIREDRLVIYMVEDDNVNNNAT
ncbi:helix-turn-helix domain-containing protein [candidate division WOR-3 bacterium]|nr:helix-turn-helix domain-containing protein [candidate division WOR-3 bacterium]